MDKLTNLYMDYVENGNEKSFGKLYSALYNILKSKFGGNTIFSNPDYVLTFDDIFQETIIKLYNKKSQFNSNKANIVTYSYTIFRNKLIDEQRRKKLHKVNIDINNVYLI